MNKFAVYVYISETSARNKDAQSSIIYEGRKTVRIGLTVNEKGLIFFQ